MYRKLDAVAPHQITFSLPDKPLQPGDPAGRVLYLYSSLGHPPLDGDIQVETRAGALSYTKPDGVWVREKTVEEAKEKITNHLQRALDLTGANYRLQWLDVDGYPNLILVFGKENVR